MPYRVFTNRRLVSLPQSGQLITRHKVKVCLHKLYKNTKYAQSFLRQRSHKTICFYSSDDDKGGKIHNLTSSVSRGGGRVEGGGDTGRAGKSRVG